MYMRRIYESPKQPQTTETADCCAKRSNEFETKSFAPAAIRSEDPTDEYPQAVHSSWTDHEYT